MCVAHELAKDPISVEVVPQARPQQQQFTRSGSAGNEMMKNNSSMNSCPGPEDLGVVGWEPFYR